MMMNVLIFFFFIIIIYYYFIIGSLFKDKTRIRVGTYTYNL